MMMKFRDRVLLETQRGCVSQYSVTVSPKYLKQLTYTEKKGDFGL